MAFPLNVFCCYAREDQEMLEQLKKHLMPFQRQGQILIWSDTNLDAGVEWEKELHQHLESADIILLLISPDFMVSDYCYSTEMKRAIELHDQGNAQVIPILLRSTFWQDAPFAKLQIVPTNAEPVTNWPSRDRAFLDIAEQVSQVITRLASNKANKHSQPDKIGQQIGNYRLISLLGRGGFAEVYLGKHVHIHLQAAIKVLRIQLGQNYQTEFQQEADLIARLKHPHIIRILDFGVDSRDLAPYLIMDYAQHGTLRDRHPKGSIVPLETIVPNIQQIAQALQYAHAQNVIHRDLKPENLLVGENGAMLLSDFGIAALAHSTSSMQTQAYAGSIPYSAPEQIQGKPRRESDQYALGIILYEWLTGNRPFQGTMIEIVSQHLGTAPAPMREKRSDIPPAVETVIMRALAKDPHQRFESVRAFADALEGACASSSRVSMPPTKATLPASESSFLAEETHLPIPSPLLPNVPVAVKPAKQSSSQRFARLGLAGLMIALLASGGILTRLYLTTRHLPAAPMASSQTSYVPSGWKLALSDPLNKPLYWQGGSNANSDDSCQFRNGAYYVQAQGMNNFCTGPAPVFSNLVFEVTMKIIRGSCGGIWFRGNYSAGAPAYFFQVCQNQNYLLLLFDRPRVPTLLSKTSSAIHAGLNQSNLIAVVTIRNHFDLYVNRQKVGSVSDSTLSSGQINIAAVASINSITEVAYQDAKVWTPSGE